MSKNGYSALEDIDYFDTKLIKKQPVVWEEHFEEVGDLVDFDCFDSKPKTKKEVDLKKKPTVDLKKKEKKKDGKKSEKGVKGEKDKKDIVIETDFENEEIPIKPIYYTVQRDGNYWQADFPMALHGLVDKNEYYQTVTQASAIARSILSKWCYSDKFVGTMLVSGVFLLLPYVPGLVLSYKRDKKVKAAVDAYFEGVNRNWETKGYKWTFTSLLGIKIKFTDPKQLTQQQTFLLLAQAQTLTTGAANM